MKKTILRDCLRIARDKLTLHPQYDCFAHYAFIVQDNKVIDWSTNTSEAPPKHFGYNTRIRDGSPKSHAEFNAYYKARGILDHNKVFDCINIRLNRRSETKISAPCSCCTNFLMSLGCKACYFTTNSGWAKCLF